MEDGVEDGRSAASLETMLLGQGKVAEPRMATTADTVRAECEHWKAYLGW